MEVAQQIMESYAANTTARQRGPLFLYYASHAVHTPMEVPQPNLDRFLPIKELTLPGQGYAALVTVLDDYEIPAYDIQAVYPQQRYLPAKVRFFIDYLKDIYNTPGYWENRAD